MEDQLWDRSQELQAAEARIAEVQSRVRICVLCHSSCIHLQRVGGGGVCGLGI